MRDDDPAVLSVAEIRDLVERRGAALGESFLRGLEADPRAGARALARTLRGRRESGRAERARRRDMLRFERRLWRAGARLVAGVDEAGMGPLAGPVVAAAVILAPDAPVGEADDSKRLDRATRERLAAVIRSEAVAVAVGVASVEDIAGSDVYRAGLLAMRRAVLALVPEPEHVLVDARRIPDLPWPQEAHVKGDARSCSIAAASIVAKVHRDALMDELARLHPGYGFERHAGYGTPEHLDALRRLGPSPAHRTTWRAVDDLAGRHSEAFFELHAALPGGISDLAGWSARVQAALPRLSAEEVRRLDALARSRGARSRKRRHAPEPELPLG